MTFNERVLIQMTKAVRLLEEENYNEKCLRGMKQIIKELREEMNVRRVCVENGKIEYNYPVAPEKPPLPAPN